MINDLTCTVIGTILGAVIWACPADSQVSPQPQNLFQATPSSGGATAGYLSLRTIVNSDVSAVTSLPSLVLVCGNMPALTGDISASLGTCSTTLATVNANVGSFGSSSAI